MTQANQPETNLEKIEPAHTDIAKRKSDNHLQEAISPPRKPKVDEKVVYEPIELGMALQMVNYSM